jgi:hypothetical protein
MLDPWKIRGNLLALTLRMPCAALKIGGLPDPALFKNVIGTYPLDGALPGPVPQSLVAPHSHNLAAD